MTEANETADRYRDINDVISQALDDERYPSGQVVRFEATCLATGEATWRAWPVGAEEPEGGYYPPETSTG
jgi:hypothetical protein